MPPFTRRRRACLHASFYEKEKGLSSCLLLREGEGPVFMLALLVAFGQQAVEH
jgi:hypothetical protein